MPRLLQILFFSIIGIIAFIILITVALLLIVDINAYKPQLQAAVSENMGMEVNIGGQLRVDLFSGVLVTLEDIHIRNRGKDLVSVKQVSLGIDPVALLDKEVRIEKLVLKHPRIRIERDVDGTFNFADPKKTENNLPPLNLVELSVSDGSLIYEDLQSGEKVETENCSVDMNNLRYSGGKSSNLLKNLFFAAQFSCGKIQRKNITVSDVQFSAQGKNGIFIFNPVTMNVFGAKGSGRIQADYSGVLPVYDLDYSLPQFQIEGFFATFSPEKIVEGAMDFSTNLSVQGKNLKTIKKELDGKIVLKGNNLILQGSDLDEKISQYESSQNFSLIDIGASLFAGPLGLAVTKGYDFVSILEKSEGSSEIRRFVSEWKVEGGVALAQDVAMATYENRVAVQGQLDIVEEEFANMTMAVIDAMGCAMVQQKIHGTFSNPVIDKPNIIKSLSGPVLGLLEIGRELLPGGECKVFYSGSVSPPE
jgi:AsmA protein